MERTPADEAGRIRAAVARRERGGSGARYHPLHPAALLERQQMERGLVRALTETGLPSLADSRILDVGTGDGSFLLRLLSLGARSANVCGVDLLRERLAAGSARLPWLQVAAADGRRLPFADGAFDITLQRTMLSSVLDDSVRADLARDMERVTRPGGCIIWYDMRVTRPDNRDIRAVGVREARRLHPAAEISSRVTTLNPLLARRILPRFWALAELLGAVPWLCGHRITVIRLPRSAAGTVADRHEPARRAA